jgi:hypothetical protein
MRADVRATSPMPVGKAGTDGGFRTGGGGGSGLTLRQAAAPPADTVSWLGFATSAYR